MPDPILIDLSRTLATCGDLRRHSIVAGFDGFVDEMITVVGERRSVSDFTPMASMAELGAILTTAAGRNGLREIVVRSADAGGCSLNLGDGLAALGVAVHHVGTTGAPQHPAFAEFAARCASCTAWGTVYGRTLAFEFPDGKFFFSGVAQLGEMTPELVERHLADGSYARACAAAGVIVVNNWTLYPHMTAVWALLRERVWSHLPQRPWCFVDLVDPSGRAEPDIRAMLGELGRMNTALRVVFGLNLTEATVIAKLVGVAVPQPDPADLARCAADLRDHLGVSNVVLHNRSGNASADASTVVSVAPGPLCANPVKSTGAGDRFNAGYCLGLLLGLAPAARLHLGSAVAGAFLRRGRSATLSELRDFVSAWADGRAVG